MSPKPNIPRQVESLDIENQAVDTSSMGLFRLTLLCAELVVFFYVEGKKFSLEAGL